MVAFTSSGADLGLRQTFESRQVISTQTSKGMSAAREEVKKLSSTAL